MDSDISSHKIPMHVQVCVENFIVNFCISILHIAFCYLG